MQDYTFTDYLRAFWAEERTEAPFLNQLWFVRNLFVLMLFSPVIYALIRLMRGWGILAMAVVWYFGAEWYYWVNTFFCFFAGAWFSINGHSLIESINRYRRPIVLLFILFSVSDLLFMNHPVSHYLHRAELLLGAPFFLTLISWLVSRGTIRNIPFLSASSFFVYIIHDPMLRFIRKFSLTLLDQQSEIQMIAAYFGAIALDLAIVYTVYQLLSLYAPRFLHWASGGR